MTENHQNRNSATMELVDPNSLEIFQRRPLPQGFMFDNETHADVAEGNVDVDDQNFDGAEAEARTIPVLAAESSAVTAFRTQLSEVRVSMAKMKAELALNEDFGRPGLGFSDAIENIKRVGQTRDLLIRNMEEVHVLKREITNILQESKEEEQEKAVFIDMAVAQFATVVSQTPSTNEESYLNRKLGMNVLQHIIETEPEWGPGREQSLAKLEYLEDAFQLKGQTIVTEFCKNTIAYSLVPIARTVLPKNAAAGNNSEAE